MMRKKNYITASQILQAASCRHAFFLEYYGDPGNKRKESDAELHVYQQGLAYQQEVLDSLPEMHREDAPLVSLAGSFRTTKKWMEEGASLIWQGALVRDDYAGIPDILQRVSRPSRLGEFSYEPVEIKSHKTVNFYDRLQLLFYAFLLEPILGYRPGQAKLIGDGGERQEVYFTPKLERQFSELLQQMESIRAGQQETVPLKCSACNRCLWSDFCMQEWLAADCVSLLSGLSASMAKKLAMAGITTCRQVSETEAGRLEEILGVPGKLCRRFVSAARARTEQRPLVLRQPAFPAGKVIYYYDIETCDDVVFCHGIIRVRDGRVDEKSFFAETPDREEKCWYELLDFMASEENCLVYCWTYYERYFIDANWRKYGGNEAGYRILRENLTDQCAFVREHFALPCRGYSIKAVAPYFGFRWQSRQANGMNCVAWYRKWLEQGDAADREKIVQYNLDDVRAMRVIDEKLQRFVEKEEA